MPAKFVFVTEIRPAKTVKGKDYQYFIDQDHVRWNLFMNEKVELNKGYTITYEVEGEYSNIKKVEPVINVWKQEALKEVASKNDITKNLAVATSYAVTLIANGMATLEDLEKISLRIYDFIQKKSDEFYNTTQQKQ